MSVTGGQTNTRHNYLYRYFWDTVPRFQFLTNLSEACAINNTDRPHVHAYKRSKSLGAASCRATDKELVAGGEKYEWRCDCSVAVPDIMACSFGCTFSRCALMLLVVEWLAICGLHCLHTTLSPGSAFFPSADQNPMYFQTGLFRLLGVQTTLSAAELGSELSAITFFSLPSASALVFVMSHF